MNAKLKVPLIGAGVVVALVAMYLFFGSGGSAPSTSAAPLRATTLVREMSITAATSTEAKNIASSTSAFVGDTLATSKTGRGILEKEGGTATLLDYDTSLTLTEGGERTRGFLAAGAMWARVEKTFGQGEYYEIKTQNAVAVVRGTSFGVSYKNNLTTVVVSAGVVGVRALDPTTGEPREGAETRIEAGHKAVVDDFGTVHLVVLLTEDLKDPWYIFNNPVETPIDLPVQAQIETTTTIGPVEITTGAGEPLFAPTLTLRSVRPETVLQGDLITLYGTGFSYVTSVSYNKTKLVPGDYDITSDTTLEVNTASLPAGTFDLTLVDSSGATVTLSQAVSVTVPPVPTPNTYPPRTI